MIMWEIVKLSIFIGWLWLIYEFFISPYLLKRKIKKLETEIGGWLKLISNPSDRENTAVAEEVDGFIRFYEKTPFKDEGMRYQILKLLLAYIVSSFQLENQLNLQAVASGDKLLDAEENVIIYSRQKRFLKEGLKGILTFLRNEVEQESGEI